MYTPRAFVEADLAALDQLVVRDNFITLVTVADAAPCISHVPVLYRRDGNQVVLEGHWAKPNPQSRHQGAALIIVHGPHAYISPGWYTDKEEAARVPTWNYAVAHLHGTLERFDDELSLASQVDRLSQQHESRVGSDWRFEHDRADLVSQLRGIVGFRFVAERMEMKFKLNQNHPPANVLGAAQALRAQGDARSSEIAELMLDHLSRRATC